MAFKVHGLHPRRRLGSRSHTAQDQAPAQFGTEESSAQAKHTPNMVPQVISITDVTTGKNSSPGLRQVKTLSGAAGDRAEYKAAAQVQDASWRPSYHQLKTGVHLEQPVRKPRQLGTKLGTGTLTTELRPGVGTWT